MRNIGLRLKESVFNVSIAKIVRKYRNLSISEIKKIVLNKGYLYECDIINASGIKTVLMIRDELNKEKIKCEICIDGKITSDEYLNNLLVSYKETEKQVEAEMNREALLEQE